MKRHILPCAAFFLGIMMLCGGCGSAGEDELKDYKVYRVEGDNPAELLNFLTDQADRRVNVHLKNTAEDKGKRINLLTFEQSANEYGYTLAGMDPAAYTIIRDGEQIFVLSPTENGIRRGCSYLLHELVTEKGDLNLPEGYVCPDTGSGVKDGIYIKDTPVSEYTIYYDGKKEQDACEELWYYIQQTSGDLLSMEQWKDQEGPGIRLTIDSDLGEKEGRISVDEGEILIAGSDADSLYREVYLFINTYLGWKDAGGENAHISSVSRTVHIPGNVEEREAWIEEREAIVVLWNVNFTRGVHLNEAVSLKNNILDFTEDQLYEYVKMLKFCGFTGVQVTDMCSAWAGADSYETTHEKIRMLAEAAHCLDMKFTLWVWGAKFEGFNWVDKEVSYNVGDSGFSYDNPDTVKTFEKYYSRYAELADCCDRVIAHFYDPGELKTAEDIAYFSTRLRDKFLSVNPDIDFGVSCWVDAYDKEVFVKTLGNDITLYEGVFRDEEQDYVEFRQDVARFGTRLGTWAWNTCEMEIDQLAQMNFNMDIIRETYHTARKYDDICKPGYWSEMDSYHILNAFSLYCAGQMLINPDIDPDILYTELSRAVAGEEYAEDFAEILMLIQDARSGSTWNQFWWSSDEYILKSDQYPAESILERCDRYIPVLQEMIDNHAESNTFPFPVTLEEVLRMMLPHLEQIRSFAEFRTGLEELELSYERGASKEELEEALYAVAQPVSDYNSIVGTWGQVEARAQREMVVDFCTRAGTEIPVYPEWDRQRKQYIYAQIVTDQKGKDTPVNVYAPYYQYGVAFGSETERLVEELVQEGLFIRNEDGSIYLTDWEKYKYSFD